VRGLFLATLLKTGLKRSSSKPQAFYAFFAGSAAKKAACSQLTTKALSNIEIFLSILSRRAPLAGIMFAEGRCKNFVSPTIHIPPSHRCYSRALAAGSLDVAAQT